jgi:hypothetical protein
MLTTGIPDSPNVITIRSALVGSYTHDPQLFSSSNFQLIIRFQWVAASKDLKSLLLCPSLRRLVIMDFDRSVGPLNLF